MNSDLQVRRDGSVAVLTLSRPGHFNALSDALLSALASALAAAAADDAVRAIVLTGAGRAFCSGADMSGPGAGGAGRDYAGILSLPAAERDAELRRIGDATRDGLLDQFHPLMLQLRASAKPVICAVNGVAAGGGVGLALSCDIVLAARNASFVQVFAPKLGLVPDCGATWHLPRAVGTSRALALALLGDPLPAEEAQRLGLVWKVVDGDDLLPEALRIAVRLAANPGHVNALVKQAILASHGNSLAEQLDLEARLQGDCGAMPSFVEGVMAFQQKRPPVFHPPRTD